MKNVELNSELKMPLPNEFIPTNFEVHKTEVTTVWHNYLYDIN